MKYLSHSFDNNRRVNVYIVGGQRYKKVFGYGKFKGIAFENNNELMKLFTPQLQKLNNLQIYQPRFSVPHSHMDNGQMRYEMNHIHGTRNEVQNTCIPKVETEAVGVNTQNQAISTCKLPL